MYCVINYVVLCSRQYFCCKCETCEYFYMYSISLLKSWIFSISENLLFSVPNLVDADALAPNGPSHQQLPCWRFRYLRSSQWDLTVRPYVVYEYHDHNETTLVIDDALVPTRCQAINNYRVDPVRPVTVRPAWQLCTLCIFPVVYTGCCLLVVADALALKRLQAISNH